MKLEASEPNRNEKNIKHRILSWYGEHKMLTRLLILGLLVLSVSGAYWYFSEGGCEDINLSLAWESIDTYEIEGNPAIRAYEDEEVKLMVTVSTTKSGVLRVMAKPESMKPIRLTMTKENPNSWRNSEIEVYFHSIEGQLQPVSHPVWVTAERDRDGLPRHSIIVEAYFVNEECSVTKYAYIDVSKGPYPTPTPTPTPGPIEEAIEWAKQNPIPTIIILGVVIFAIYEIRKRKRKKKK